MTLTSQPSTQFSEFEAEEIGEYRPLNRTAVLAFLLGLASFFSLFHPALYLIPAAGFLAGLLSLRGAGRSEVKHSGRAFAIVGIFCSVLFVSWSIARTASRDRYIYGHAREYAQSWLELFQQGKYYEAHQLTMSEDGRLERGGSLEKHYARARPDMEALKKKHANADVASPEKMRDMMSAMEPTPKEQFESFFMRPTIQKIRAMGPTAAFRIVSNGLNYSIGWARERVEIRAEAKGMIEGEPRTITFDLLLERNCQSGPGDWRIYDIVDAT